MAAVRPARAGIPVSVKLIVATSAGFHGDATIAGFRGAEAEVVRGVARRFSAPVKTAPFAVPAARLAVGELAQGRTFAIERTPATAFAIVPPAR